MFAKKPSSARVKKALGIYRQLITRRRRRTTKVAFWDPPSESKNLYMKLKRKTMLKMDFI